MNILKSFILFFVTIIMLSFFDARFIPRPLIEPLITIVSWFLILININFRYKPIKPRIADSLATPINLLLAAIFISMIPAVLYHDQSIFNSLRGYKNFYVFFLYFILFKIDFSQKQILNLSIFLFFITLFIYVIDYVTFPNVLFASQDSYERRGAFTIVFNGQGFTLLGTFFFLSAFFRTARLYYFIFYVIGFCFLSFFSSSRTLLFSLLICTLFILIYHRRSIKKYFLYIIPVLVVALTAGIYYLQSYILGLFLLTLDQGSTGDSIRYEAIKFFTNKFQPNVITKIVGNGYPKIGAYGDSLVRIQEQYRYYIADIGLIGFWTYFGILGLIAWLVIFKKILFSKTDNNNVFIKAYFIYLLFTITLGYAIFSPGYMITTVFCFFLFDKNKQDKLS